jgi:anti-anti-sigma regulatory factor
MNQDPRYVFKELPDRGLALLRVQGEMGFEERKAFVGHCEGLLESSQARLALDLSRVGRLFSVYLGTVADLSERAKQAGKALSVLVNKRQLEMFRQANLDQLLDLVEVDGS